MVDWVDAFNSHSLSFTLNVSTLSWFDGDQDLLLQPLMLVWIVRSKFAAEKYLSFVCSYDSPKEVHYSVVHCFMDNKETLGTVLNPT
jgi:hypothetical protein